MPQLVGPLFSVHVSPVAGRHDPHVGDGVVNAHRRWLHRQPPLRSAGGLRLRRPCAHDCAGWSGGIRTPRGSYLQLGVVTCARGVIRGRRRTRRAKVELRGTLGVGVSVVGTRAPFGDVTISQELERSFAENTQHQPRAPQGDGGGAAALTRVMARVEAR
jgi:hypothetical protein